MGKDESEESRLAWTEGPDDEASEQSWLLLDDDELLHRIESLEAGVNEDERLLEVVASNRHFFIRQEAAKRMRNRDRLFDYEDDRHVGQILVRYLTRREDVTYLERLSKRSQHVEVRSAAQVQLARLWQRLEADPAAVAAAPNPDPPPAAAPAPAAPAPAAPAPAAPAPAASSRPVPAPARKPATPKAASVAAVEAKHPAPVEPITSAAVEKGGVDGSLLAWAVHFLVEPTWSDIGTERTRELLTRTRRELLGRHPTLVQFEITADAHVKANLDAGLRLPTDSVRAVAAWMTAYRAAARELAPEVTATSVRAATAMVADALRDAGFYAACDQFESGRP